MQRILACHKKNFQIVLESLKTHTVADLPQKVTILGSSGMPQKNFQIVLESSKTHTVADLPQKVTILGSEKSKNPLTKYSAHCPFEILRQYIDAWGSCRMINDPFFIFRNGTPVKPRHLRAVMKRAIADIGLDLSLYDTVCAADGHVT